MIEYSSPSWNNAEYQKWRNEYICKRYKEALSQFPEPTVNHKIYAFFYSQGYEEAAEDYRKEVGF